MLLKPRDFDKFVVLKLKGLLGDYKKMYWSKVSDYLVYIIVH